jgi:uncharacterized protein YjbI with pentapeptide repeats
MKSSKRPPAQREQPDLPLDWESAPLTRLAPDGGEIHLESRQVEDVAWLDGKTGALRLEGCVLRHVRFTGSEFGSVVWKDVRLIGCDLANCKAHRMSLLRVEMEDCRLSGLSSPAADWRDVLVANSDARFAQFPGGVFQRCEFTSTGLQEADLRGADLRGALLRACRLGRADLRQARLRETDLRHSDLDEMLVGLTDLAGAIVDAPQAMVLARLMGLQIR